MLVLLLPFSLPTLDTLDSGGWMMVMGGCLCVAGCIRASLAFPSQIRGPSPPQVRTISNISRGHQMSSGGKGGITSTYGHCYGLNTAAFSYKRQLKGFPPATSPKATGGKHLFSFPLTLISLPFTRAYASHN